MSGARVFSGGRRGGHLSEPFEQQSRGGRLTHWLAGNGWKDENFPDLDPQRGITAGERWERALNEAANRCEAGAVPGVESVACVGLVMQRTQSGAHLNKRLFDVLIEDLPGNEPPEDLPASRGMA